jgi:hypothetical protein
MYFNKDYQLLISAKEQDGKQNEVATIYREHHFVCQQQA